MHCYTDSQKKLSANCVTLSEPLEPLIQKAQQLSIQKYSRREEGF